MPSYLEAYGAAEEQRVKRVLLVKNVSIVLAVILVVGLTLYFIFRNYAEEQQAKAFVSLLRAQDYRGAYRMWGCTDTHPCPDYSFEKFQEDWGPTSGHADQSSAEIGLSRSCGSGVVIRLDYKGAEEPVALWVETDTKVISFAPWADCPGRHLRIVEWVKSLFGR
jgi:hypothetical protein